MPRPETPANAAFRRDYVARWSAENTLLCGVTRQAEYPRVMHPLSIKMAWGGREVYRLRVPKLGIAALVEPAIRAAWPTRAHG